MAVTGGIEMTKKFTVYATLSEIEADSVEEAWSYLEEWYDEMMEDSETYRDGIIGHGWEMSPLFDIVEESK